MGWLRFLALVILSLWIGGLATLAAIAAPSLFAVLQVTDPSHGRELAGALFGTMFQQFEIDACIGGTLLLATLGLRAALGPRPRWLGLRLWTTMLMVVASAGTIGFIVPRINRIRTSVAVSIAALPMADARRIEFGRLHGLAGGLTALTLFGGLGLLLSEARDN